MLATLWNAPINVPDCHWALRLASNEWSIHRASTATGRVTAELSQQADGILATDWAAKRCSTAALMPVFSLLISEEANHRCGGGFGPSSGDRV
jgi:hypothetical protein